jgi:uncharacterized membrane protein
MTTAFGATHPTGTRITRLLLRAGKKAWPLGGSERERAERKSATRFQIIDRFLVPLTLSSALGCGLVAGVFFGFSTFVMKALEQLPPAQGIAAMQAINVTVINPWFMVVLFGTVPICILLAVSAVSRWQEPGTVYLLAGSLLYFGGTILVTMMCNVPLNDTLATTNPARAGATDVWSNFVSNWTAWNHVRTAAALGASVLFILALTKQCAAGAA